ncbi:hypothetical protein [Roseicella aquatilis]|uniref:Uncharacterized protein n=1 Tax=Roseicella aquatilis TaxID=2527868 RepID=A0A4R4D4Z7_9PROT|nr:hypothetical protein [Roseicella aquatilis]TCZ53886.1 hypothetical protein EXY23_24060 [Roseicella aquatilis]
MSDLSAGVILGEIGTDIRRSPSPLSTTGGVRRVEAGRIVVVKGHNLPFGTGRHPGRTDNNPVRLAARPGPAACAL